MPMIDSERFKHHLITAKDARAAWVAATNALLAVDRYDRLAWAKAQKHNEQMLNAYNSKARDVTTVMQLLLEQAEYYGPSLGKTTWGE
ncbi:hypothetical protein ACYZTX_29000 [Pseudomonas sp. MDT1-17]